MSRSRLVPEGRWLAIQFGADGEQGCFIGLFQVGQLMPAGFVIFWAFSPTP